MGRFDSQTDAALAQLNYEALSETPGGEFAEIIGDLLMLVGTGGLWAVAGGASNLLLKIRKLAGASYASNLIYSITAVRDDLADLYQRQEAPRGRIDSLRSDPRFAEAISALALRAMQTSVKDRLKRLARIVVNGVKEDDLEAESLDDMMRAAAELRDHDVQVLGSIYKMQVSLLTPAALQAPYVNRLNNLNGMWMNWWKGDGACYLRDAGMAYRTSCVRLQTVGFIASIGSNSILDGPSKINYELLLEGKKFYERLREVGTAI